MIDVCGSMFVQLVVEHIIVYTTNSNFDTACCAVKYDIVCPHSLHVDYYNTYVRF